MSSIDQNVNELHQLAVERNRFVIALLPDTGLIEPIMTVQVDVNERDVTVIPTVRAKKMFPDLLGLSVTGEPFLIEGAQPDSLALLLGIKPAANDSRLLDVSLRAAEKPAISKFILGPNLREITQRLNKPANQSLIVLNPDGEFDPQRIDAARQSDQSIPVIQKEGILHQVFIKYAPIGVPELALTVEYAVLNALAEQGVNTAPCHLARDSSAELVLLSERFDREPFSVNGEVTAHELRRGSVAMTFNEALATTNGTRQLAFSGHGAAAWAVNGRGTTRIDKQKTVLALYMTRMMGNTDLHGDNFSLLLKEDRNSTVQTELAPLYDLGGYGFFQSTTNELQEAKLLTGSPPLAFTQAEIMRSLRVLRDFDHEAPESSREAFIGAISALHRSEEIARDLADRGVIVDADAECYQKLLRRPLMASNAWHTEMNLGIEPTPALQRNAGITL